MQNIKYNIAIPINVIKEGINAKNLIITNVIMLNNIIIVMFCQFVNLIRYSLSKKLLSIVA